MTNDDYKVAQTRRNDSGDLDAAVETAAEIIVAILVAAVSFRLISQLYLSMLDVIAGIWGTYG